MAVRLTPTSLDDGLPMDEWLRLRTLQLGAGPGWADPDPGFASGALPADPATLSDSLPMADWQRMRAAQAGGDEAISFASGDDSLAGGAGSDVLDAQPPPGQTGSGRQAEPDGDIAAGHGLGGLADAARRVVGSLFGGSSQRASGDQMPAKPQNGALTPVPGTEGAGASPSQVRVGAHRYGTGAILGLLAQGEAGPNGYDTTYGQGWKKTWYPPAMKKPTQLTIDDWIALGPQLARANGSSAMGMYQFMPGTLQDLKRRMGLSGSEVMTPALQDEMAEHQLAGRGFYKFVAGEISPEAFQQNLAQEWRSLARDATDYAYSPPGQPKIRARIPTRDIQSALAAARTTQRTLDEQLDAGHLPPP